MRLLTICALAAAVAAQGFEPPRLRSAALPTRQPPDVIGGGEVLLELTVPADGGAARVTALTGTPPFTELLRDAVARWRFEPAREDGRTLEWPVLVAALFRAPVLAGPAPPSPSREPGRPCREVPFVVERELPPYPPTALGDSLVLVEATVGTDGLVTQAQSVVGKPPFAEAALAAAREWRFRPACRDGRPLPVPAYLVFGFRSPVTPPVRFGGNR